VVLQRLVAHAEWSRPLAQGWTGAWGASWQRSSCREESGRRLAADCYGKPLQHSTTEEEDVASMLHARLLYSSASDSALVLSAEQALPLRPHWLAMTRLQLRAERAVPLPRGVRLSLQLKAGLIAGDLPPYEAFPLGGTNSVRGYDEGGVGAGRRFAVGTAELLVPLAGAVSGVLFADAGSDLETGHSVLGDPGGTRGKPGSGCGVGAGLRLDSPLGPWRFEYALSDRGVRRFHLGMATR
jgi:outer membrane protein insertion porin family